MCRATPNPHHTVDEVGPHILPTREGAEWAGGRERELHLKAFTVDVGSRQKDTRTLTSPGERGVEGGPYGVGVTWPPGPPLPHLCVEGPLRPLGLLRDK